MSSSDEIEEALSRVSVSSDESMDKPPRLCQPVLNLNPRLSGCMVTDEGCCYLASALSSNPSHLRELDLSYNHPQHSTLQLLTYQDDPNYTLNKLNLEHGGLCRIKPGLQKYACDLTLDPNTANCKLLLSEDNRKATHVKDLQQYANDPDRFEGIPQVLCRESLTGRCYWEAEYGEWARTAVAYKGISRKEASDSMFGVDDKSWSIFSNNNGFTIRHNNKRLDIPAPSSLSNRVGVYLDCSACILSFYSVSDTSTHRHTHLHTFHINSTFDEPLYAGFAVYKGHVRIIDFM